MKNSDQYPKTKAVMRIRELSDLTGLSISFLYKCSKILPHYKRGKFLYYDRREILKWLKQNRINPPTKPGGTDDHPGSITIE